MKAVKFKHKSWEVAAILQFPKGFDESKTYPAVVCAHPISSFNLITPMIGEPVMLDDSTQVFAKWWEK